MEIQSSSPLHGPVAGRAAENSLVPFKIGQILPATVVRTLPGEGQIRLNIGGRLVNAQTTRLLAPGQILKLEVVESGALPKLKIISPASGGVVRDKILLNNIALQKSPAVVANQLLALSRTTSGIDSLPAETRHPAQRLLALLPDLRDLSTPRGIRRAIAESGVFLEARLGLSARNEGESFDHDLKAGLLRLAARAEAANPFQDRNAASANPSRSEADLLSQTLAESARSALGRIVMNQVASLPENPSGRQAWNLEIAFLNTGRAESAKLTIQREARARPARTEPEWSVMIELDPPNLGPLRTKIRLADDRVHVYFCTQSESTRDRIQSSLDLLETQLIDAGLAAGYLATGTGFAGEKPMPTRVQHLFDERA